VKMVNWNKRTSYLGRNGRGHCLGAVVSAERGVVVVRPLNSKGNVASAWIEVPTDDIPKFVAALLRECSGG